MAELKKENDALRTRCDAKQLKFEEVTRQVEEEKAVSDALNERYKALQIETERLKFEGGVCKKDERLEKSEVGTVFEGAIFENLVHGKEDLQTPLPTKKLRKAGTEDFLQVMDIQVPLIVNLHSELREHF